MVCFDIINFVFYSLNIFLSVQLQMEQMHVEAGGTLMKSYSVRNFYFSGMKEVFKRYFVFCGVTCLAYMCHCRCWSHH